MNDEKIRVRQQWVPLRVLTWNTHKGAALAEGGLKWMLGRSRPDIILLQEIPSVEFLRRHLRRQGLLKQYRILPAQGFPGERGLPFILVRRKRFGVAWVSAPRISFGSKHDRRRTAAGLVDRRAGWMIRTTSIHTDPLGKGFFGASRGARKLHVLQTKAYAAVFGRDDSHRFIEVGGGDMNEHVGESNQHQNPDTATRQFQRVGMEMAHRYRGKRIDQAVRLDDIVFREREGEFVLEARRVLSPPVRSNDHDAVFCRFLVLRRPSLGFPLSA